MEQKRCNNGHYFDPTRHTSCPHCKIKSIEIRSNTDQQNSYRKMPIEKTYYLKDDKKEVAVIYENQEIAKENIRRPSPKEGMTVGMYHQKMGIDPVVGWLVCVEGPNRGRDYRIRCEKNFIGRSEKMDICIVGDESVSRENHAIISYNPKVNIFRIYPGDGRGLVYLNDDEVLSAVKLNDYDVIEIGQSRFMFISFCEERFKWD